MAPIEMDAVTSDCGDDRWQRVGAPVRDRVDRQGDGLVEGRAGGRFGHRVPGAGWPVVDAETARLLQVQRQARHTASAASGRASFVYDANEDGPWPRTDDQITAAIGELLVTAAEVELIGPGAGEPRGRDGQAPPVRRLVTAPHVLSPPQPLTPQQAYAYGACLAAYWTMDASPLTPMDGREVLVTDDAVKAQAGLADQVRRVSRERGVEVMARFAEGVLGWLSWLVGGRDRVWPA